MKFLTDKEILSWNKYNGLGISPIYRPDSNHPYIKIENYEEYEEYGGGIREQRMDINSSIGFIFSVSDMRSDEFFDILDILLKRKMCTSALLNGSLRGLYIDVDFMKGLRHSDSMTEHYVGKTLYRRYSINKNIIEMIPICSYLNDAIEFISLLWGYDESGKEHLLLDNQKGDIVSVDNRNGDFIILDYDYIKIRDQYIINYIICEIFIKGNIIKYGDISSVSDGLRTNRLFKINQLLN